MFQKLIFILTFQVLSFPFLSQNKAKLNSSIDIVSTTKALCNNDFSNDLKVISSLRLLQPLNYLGISMTSGFMVNGNPSSEIDGYFEYLQVIPQTILIQDSIEGKINGFNFGLVLGGIDLIKKPSLDLITCFGLNIGRVWINGADIIKQKNPYFAPMFVIIPRVCLGKISLQFRCAYDFDISNKNWKRKGFNDSELMPLNKFSSTGLNLSFGIGYVLD